MKKILIISNSIMAEALAMIIQGMGCDGIYSTHEDALFAFASENLSHVVICEYDNGMIGEKTFADISKSATNQIIIRCSFSKLNAANYLQLPCELNNLKQILKL